jgi:hypothetical protein
VRAAIAAMDGIRRVQPRARFLHGDPVMQVIAPQGRPELEHEAGLQSDHQYQAWDMLSGRLAPELGGKPSYLDVVGANFYHANILEWPDHRISWEEREHDARWPRLRHLLSQVSRRYGRPIVVSETSHFGAGRASWLRMIHEEVMRSAESGVSVQGVCLYPVLDRPDWDQPSHWHRCGLWDIVPSPDGHLLRVPCEEYLAEFDRVRQASRTMAEPSVLSTGCAGRTSATNRARASSRVGNSSPRSLSRTL